MSEIYQIVVIATIAAFIILFLGKTGLRTEMRDWYDTKGIGLFADMLDCDFCLSFWLCLVLTILVILLTGNTHWLVAIICAPPITRILL